MRRCTCGPERSPSNIYLDDGESAMHSIDMLTHSGDMKVEKMKREEGKGRQQEWKLTLTMERG